MQKKKTNSFTRTLRSTLLCVKYPFLYPRNRWTGKHYNNWDLNDKLKKLYSEAYKAHGKENGFKVEVVNRWKAILYKVFSFWYDHPMQWIHFPTRYTEWDAIPDGWGSSFGDRLLKELREAIIEDGGRKYLHSVRIMDIKEKWGRLEIYLNAYGDKTFKLIQKYGEISESVCITCGKPAVGYTNMKSGWICPYCDDCRKDLAESEKMKWLEKNGIKWFTFFGEKEDED